MIESVNLILLEAYINGEISADEVLLEDGSPLSKSELDTALEEFNDLKIHLKAAGLEKRLKTIHKEVSKEQSSNKSLKRLAIAAMILLVAIFSFLILRTPGEPEFSEYFSHFDELVTYRDSDSTNYTAGLEAYSLENYDLAYVLLESIDKLSDELKFYLGVSALGSSRPLKAVQIFENLGTASSNEYYQQVRWYLGLALWQSDESKLAINVLSQISTGEYKYEESLKLIELLKD